MNYIGTISFQFALNEYSIDSFCADDDNIYVVVYSNRISTVFRTAVDRLEKLDLYLKISEMRLKQIVVTQNKLYYLTTGGESSEFYVYREEHTRLKSVRPTTFLHIEGKEVFCVEDRDLIFVTFFKRKNIEFSASIAQLTKTRDGMILVLL